MITDRIKALLGKSSNSKVDRVKKLVNETLKNVQLEPAKHSRQLRQCRDSMEEQITRIRAQADDYPNYGIKTDIWVVGVALANYAEM